MDNINDVVNDVIKKLSIKKPDKHNKIERILDNCLTEVERKHIEIQNLKDCTVFVNVTSPIILFQLKTKKYKILKRLQEDLPEIRNIVFKIGKTS